MTPTPVPFTVPGYTQVIETHDGHLTPEQFARFMTPAEHERALRILWPALARAAALWEQARKESAS